MVYTRSTTPGSYSPNPAGPSLIRVQGLERDAAWPELPTGVEGKDRRNCGGFIKAHGCTTELLLAWHVSEGTIFVES